MGCSERQKEIKRRRHRRAKLAYYEGKLKKATNSEKIHIAEKLRALTPGAPVLIERLGLNNLDR
jgi:hypothetical protein